MAMKSALITGAASGIGKACAERMAKEGYGVVIADGAFLVSRAALNGQSLRLTHGMAMM